jgi:hypothetical protein
LRIIWTVLVAPLGAGKSSCFVRLASNGTAQSPLK